MWTDAGLHLLIAAFPPQQCTIGLYTAGPMRPEMAATRGRYQRRPLSGAPWVVTHDGAQWVLTGPEVLFTGFVSREGAVGFMVFQSATLLFWAPFADGQPRTLIDEADRLFVTPQLLFREGG